METYQTAIVKDRQFRTDLVKIPIVHTLHGLTTELLPPGSGMVILADVDSSSFDALEKAISAKDNERINEVVTQNKQSVKNLQKLTTREALSTLINAPTIVDVSYDSKLLAVNLFTIKGVGFTRFTRVIFPFAGGDFDVERFKYTAFSKNDQTVDVKVMVVLHQPNLSKIENQVLKNIPKEMSSMQFGRVGGEVMCTPAALVMTVTVGITVALVGTAAGNCSGYFGKIGDKVINPQIDAGKLLSVKELVQLRQNALTKRI